MDAVVIAGGARTPIGRYNGALAKVDAVDLGAHAVAAALERTGLEPDYVAVGNVLQAANGQNPGRRAALQGGVRRDVPGITLNDVCLASMSAVGLAAAMIRQDEASAVLVGGFDSMTRAPHALRTRPAPRMGDQPMIDVMVHDGLYC
jgi:acetyl-CoA C-acetyltransferase